MGTIICHNIHSAKDIKNQIIKEMGDKLVDYGGTGSEFYCLVNSGGNNNKKVIVLFLLRSDRGDWGYKDMDETMHPYYYNCPLRLLNKADEPYNERAKEWRKKVRTYHLIKRKRAKVIKSIKPGDRIKLIKGMTPEEVEIVSVSPLVGVVDGVRYRINPRHVEVK